MSANLDVDARRTDTRERLLVVAAELFAERGYAGTSIRDISDRLGVTKAALYYHFTSKSEILHALVAQPIANIRAVFEQPHNLTTPQGRAVFVRAVVSALAECTPGSVAIFTDPELKQEVHASIKETEITNTLALEIAKGLSGVTDVSQIDREDLLRAIGAVSAGEAMLSAWHLVNPECEALTDDAVDQITNVVIAALER